MRTIYLFLWLSLFGLPAQAQWKWIDPLQAGYPVIQNQGWSKEIGSTYARLPERAEKKVRSAVWDLSRQTAGLALYFYTNTPELKIRYQVEGALQMPHMPATGVSGLDLYRIDPDGQWQFCFGGYAFGDTIHYSYTLEEKNRYHSHGYEYRLYLPLYNSVNYLEIGIPEGKEFRLLPQSPEKPIVLYGTSIAQGACASRPGMAWSTLLQRALDYPLINLGFSGNGQLEKDVLSFICEIDARLYILDCLPNLTGKMEKEICGRTIEAVKQIRQAHTAPILLCEHAGYSNAGSNRAMQALYRQANQECRKAFEILRKEGIPNLYYLSSEEIALPPDSWVDYVHPSDRGAAAQAKSVEKKVRDLLQLPIGKYATTRPVTQRREPDAYEWQTRHRNLLERNQKNPPRSVILGNSIIHYWGGDPDAPRRKGPQSWEDTMAPAGFRNLGCGWDRIENVLWRIYHGELDGYEAEKIVLLIGTNNLDSHTDEEIVEGIRFLLAALPSRQPKATIQLVGILPRRGKEGRIKKINRALQDVAEKAGDLYVNPGSLLLGKEGKIEESWFGDGLHPNEEGYKRIAKMIAK